MSYPISTVMLQIERDLLLARQRARQIAALLGFDVQEQTRIATAVSEMARNAFQYVGTGKVEFVLEGRSTPQLLLVRISDEGPGIEDLARILEGRYHSRTGMGLGILGARRLMDQFHIESGQDRGTIVSLRKLLRAGSRLWDAKALAGLSQELSRHPAEDPLQELQRQNQELLQALDELRQRQQELLSLNRELEDTNRGVVALYAELDEKADHLRRADELKSRFLSNMSHEFRTPLNSILGLSRLLLERTDGPLSGEQEKQTLYIRKAAGDLLELVNDLLDLAKIEAGKTVVRPAEFEVQNLFSALRGMLRPLLVNESVRLVFEPAEGLPALYTDEGKVSQVLRNLISNALKFTEQGEVRVSARLLSEPSAVQFQVSDTGIGIAPEDQQSIFREFSQLDHPIQRKVKGTGLGLPLTKKLAELLRGSIAVDSQLGQGSTFTVIVPLVYTDSTVEDEGQVTEVDPVLDQDRITVLLVEDDPSDVLVYQKYLKGTPFQVIPARTLSQARQALAKTRPEAVILDIVLHGQDAWGLLAELKREPSTASVPVLVATSIEDQEKAFALGADSYGVKPVDRHWLLHELTTRTARRAGGKILLIDDEEVCRYLVRGMLARHGYRILEGAGGLQGLRRAREEAPDLILLDLVMPDLSGWEVLKQLQHDAMTRTIPVCVITGKTLSAEERTYLEELGCTVLPKDGLEPDRLLFVVRELLARSQTERPVRAAAP